MTSLCNRRVSARPLWSGLVVSTIIGCAVFVYVSLLFGTDYDSETQKYFSNSAEQLTDEICRPICNSKECVAQSNYLLNYIEPTADPCENYYEFSCGNFLERFSQNESQAFLVDQVLELKLILKRILDATKADPKSPKGKVKTVYDSCLNYNSSYNPAIPTLLEFLSNAGIPNWPNLDRDFQFNEKNLTNILGKFSTYDEYGFIDIKRHYENEIGPDSKLKTYILSTNNSYKNKERLLRKFLVEKILKYFMQESTFIKEIWEETEALNDAIVLLHEENGERSEDDDLSITCGHDDAKGRWEFACAVLESFIENAGVQEGISKQYAIVSSSSIYFIENISHLLKNFTDRSIANYLAFNLFFLHLDQLNFLFRVTSQKDPNYLDPILKKVKDLTPWQSCVEWLIEDMFLPLTFEYVKEVTTEDIKEVISLVQTTIEETVLAISRQDWMTEPIKMNLTELVQNITLETKYILLLFKNETKLDVLYEEFHPSNVNFLYNVLEHNRFSKYEDSLVRHELAKFLPIRYFHSNFLRPGASGGGGFLSVELATLLPPVYRSGLAKPFNMLTLASLIAHEVGHSLQDFTTHYVELDSEAKDYMNNTFNCIINQYSKFKYEIIGKNIIGRNLVRENFADTVSISIIDNLIEKYLSSDDASLLPGLPYTAKQMFYISAFEVWCESDSERDEIYNYEQASHSLGRFRMLGMLQNSKGFAKAFNCPEGSFMNPVSKCTFPK